MELDVDTIDSYQTFVLMKEAPTPLRLLHSALGLATEVLELTLSYDSDNSREELGDLFWYTILTKDVLSIPTEDLTLSLQPINENELTLRTLQEAIENLISLIKKHLIYEDPQELTPAFHNVWNALCTHTVACGHLPVNILHENRLKLDTRYAAKFTTEESSIRKDKQ